MILPLTANVEPSSQNLTVANSQAAIDSIFIGFIVGPIIFVWSFIIIWYNQKKSAIDYRRIKLTKQICLDIHPSSIVDSQGKLVHLTGHTTCLETIQDQISGVFCDNSVKLVRKVEVMEWRGYARGSKNNRHTQYKLEWQTQNQQNSYGRRNNPENWFIKSDQILGQKVNVGQYVLGDSQKKKCQKSVQITLTTKNAQQIALNCNRNNHPQILSDYIYFPSVNDNSISSHGALRVSYSKCPVGPITIMAKSIGNSFEPFHIAAYQNNGQQDNEQTTKCCCFPKAFQNFLKPISLVDFVYQEKLSRQQVITKQLEASQLQRNLVRIGVALFFDPITEIIGYIPLIGGFVAGVVALVILLAAIIICIPLFLLIFSIAWLFYHPKIGLIILGVAIVILAIVLALVYTL